MDTPNLPENESEEITWQDDENRATLFLRSVFVLLSGALILGILTRPSALGFWTEIIKAAVLTIILPVFIIWLFFGQGLSPVEWLTDQKYNAWNYGVNFEDRKTHFRWLISLLVLGVAETIVFRMALFDHSSTSNLKDWLGLVPILWFFGICFAWFFWGYLWFGCAQGFGEIAATAVIIIFVGYAFFQNIYQRNIALSVSAYFIPLALLCGYICWKLKSWIPILYAIILLGPIASWILMY
jgi:hypothetical protein